MKPRYLTKSIYKIALECPTKIYYHNKSEFANQKIDDAFLLALADGGFQVGELAKYYFKGGHCIESLDHNEALIQTNELLKQDEVIIYEAAIQFNDYFIRADILVKKSDHIELIEVKAKSIKAATEDSFLNKNGSIASEWKPYIYDIAFQKHVAQRAFPDFTISAYLMLADKQALCPTDGLNQKFKISKDSNGRKYVKVTTELTEADLADPLLRRINVDICCDVVYKDKFGVFKDISFSDYTKYLADNYKADKKIAPVPSVACAACEFKVLEEEVRAGLKSGFRDCWAECFSWTDEDFEESTIFDIWNFRKKRNYSN
jgi:hypothetical protein